MGCGGIYDPTVRVRPPAKFPFGNPNTSPSDPSSPNPLIPQTVSEWGVVKCSDSDHFNLEIQDFLSSTVDPFSVPNVSCSKKDTDTGGIFIRGNVNFKNDAIFSPYSTSQSLYVSDNSYLEIHIVSYNNKRIANLRMDVVPFSSKVEGNFVVLTFQDQKGKVRMDGTIKDGKLSGVFEFENFIDWRGSNYQGGDYRGGSDYNGQGQIGSYSIHACSLLNCNSVPIPSP